MKPRYISLVLVSVAAVTVAATAWLGGHAALGIHGETASARAQSSGQREIPPPDEEMSTRMSRYYADLGGLGRPRERESGGEVVFEILGFSEEAVADHHQEIRPPEESFDEHVVSLVVVTPRQRLAVIDGETYREGDTIAGTEGRLRTITADRVLVAGREIRQWIDVQDPLEREVQPTATALADNGALEPEPAAGAAEPASEEESDRQRQIREGLEALLEYRRAVDEIADE